ncbi:MULTISPECIES: hypothetical protein [Enterococcus]|nr:MULTISPECIES: hypothetical protein [Enterococcus]
MTISKGYVTLFIPAKMNIYTATFEKLSPLQQTVYGVSEDPYRK